ncbi:hypothetical protein GF319_03935 [Candidatus Bathyarchaeota archaeon]|nr:hypothetical protein [Candidatus Bathyarchaeota archaeon]
MIKMKTKLSLILAFTIVFLSLTPGVVSAEEIISRGSVTINEPVGEDLFVMGGDIIINAEVQGDVFAMAGNIRVDAPILGDIIAMGGQVYLNEDVEGKIIAASGNVRISGNAQEIIVAAGAVNIRSTSVIQNYGMLAAGEVTNAGTFMGNLNVRSSEFTNTGTVEGNLNYQKPEERGRNRFSVYNILTKVGFFAMGIAMLRVFSPVYFTFETELERSVLKKGVVGLVVGLASTLIFIILMITGVGLPFALAYSSMVFMALLFSGILVSYPLGRWIASLIRIEERSNNDIIFFSIGFIIINVLYLIPTVGFFTRIIVVSLGLGATFYATLNNWEMITA